MGLIERNHFFRMSSSGDSRFQMNRVLTEKTRQKAEKELRETPELQKQACEELRKMLQGMINIILEII